jgi:hypothetical protein
VTRYGEDAIAWLDAQNGPNWKRKCLMGVRMAFGRPGGTLYAGQAWDRALHKHRVSRGSQVPRGVPVFWETSGVADHIALSLGGGWCLSNDIKRSGYYDRALIDNISRAWGAQLQGWTEDLNGARVWNPKASGPVIDLSQVVSAARTNRMCTGSLRLKRAVAKEVGAGGMTLGNGILGEGFTKQYRLVQTKYLHSQGRPVTSKDADGTPGRSSLAT